MIKKQTSKLQSLSLSLSLSLSVSGFSYAEPVTIFFFYLRSGIAVESSLFGPGQGIVWIDNVICTGQEEHIIDCPHLGPLDNDCGHDEDVGVICTEQDGAVFCWPLPLRKLLSLFLLLLLLFVFIIQNW